MDIPNVQHLLYCKWTSKTTQKPLFFQLPVLQKLPPTFWKFLYYFYQFKPKFNADMFSRYTKIANGTTHVCTQTDITTVQSCVTASFQAGSDSATSAPSTLNGNSFVLAAAAAAAAEAPPSDTTSRCVPLTQLFHTHHNYCYYKNSSVFTKFATCYSQ